MTTNLHPEFLAMVRYMVADVVDNPGVESGELLKTFQSPTMASAALEQAKEWKLLNIGFQCWPTTKAVPFLTGEYDPQAATEAATGSNAEPVKLEATTNGADDGDESLSNLPDDAMMNHRDLAAALKLEAEPLRKRLERWRCKNVDGWQELTEATAKEPRYLYRVASVRDVLREAIKTK